MNFSTAFIEMKTLILFCYMLTLAGLQIPKGHVVQFNIDKLLNARPVTVGTNHRLITWTKGVDGGGLADGYLTQAAARLNGDEDTHALPDVPVFAANSSHPEIKLHYSNNGSKHNQACSITGAGSVEFAVPKGKYAEVFLALTVPKVLPTSTSG